MASAVAGLGASGGLIVLVALGVAGVGAYDSLLPRDAAAPPPERVTFVEAPPLPLPEPAIAPPPALPRTSAPPLPTTAAPPAPAAATPGRRTPLPAPVAPALRDTGAVRTAPGTRLPPPPRAELPGRITFPPPPVGRPADGVRAGVATGPLPLDSAGRAARLRDVSAGIADAARRRGSGSGGSVGTPTPAGDATRPGPVGGVSLAIGLPGGGPSAEERRRNREADARIQESMARVRARLDSLKADSVRRADSLRAARRPPE